MKKTIAILAASAAGFSAINAQEDISVTTTWEWQSSYVFRGVQLAEETFMPSLDFEVAGFYAGIWAALPVNHTVNGVEIDNEVDFYAGYGWGISELVSADVGFTYYTYPNAQDKFFDSDVNTFEVYGGLAFEVPFTPAIYIFRDFDVKSWTVEVSGGDSWEVALDTTFDLGAHLGYSDISGGDDYWYFGVDAGFTYAFNDYVSATVSAGWSWADEKYDFAGRIRDSRFFYGLAVSAGF